MRSFTKTLLEAAGSGFAGGLTVVMLNEVLRRRQVNVPQLQIIGRRAVRKGSLKAGLGWPSRKTQNVGALGGGMLDAAMFFSLVRLGRYPRPVLRGILLGAIAGASAPYVPSLFGLGRAPVSLTNRMRALTMGYYMAGGLMAGLTGRAFAEMRAMTPHPIKSTKRKWRSEEGYGSTEVRQADEARF